MVDKKLKLPIGWKSENIRPKRESRVHSMDGDRGICKKRRFFQITNLDLIEKLRESMKTERNL
jgi:hypothetical protein